MQILYTLLHKHIKEPKIADAHLQVRLHLPYIVVLCR